jgi:undecaprenyl diphosphate synthase
MGFFSSTNPKLAPAPRDAASAPKHIAMIMDGNGRWAKRRLMPRVAGHKRGVETVREMVRACAERGVKYLTLFAFSSENWRRPEEEVSFLMGLFKSALLREVDELHKNEIRLVVAGDLSALPPEIVADVVQAQKRTANNQRFTLTLCVNYGGRWDVAQAFRRLLSERPELAANVQPEHLEPFLAMAHAPEPDLFIRTGGEQRISNFLLWQLAYTELFFTDVLWPDFNTVELERAIEWYTQRERRFGRTSEQVAEIAAQQTAAAGD